MSENQEVLEHKPATLPVETPTETAGRLALAERGILPDTSRLRILAAGERARSNMPADPQYRPHMLAALSSDGAIDIDSVIDRKTGQSGWIHVIGYYATPWVRADKETGEYLMTAVVRLILPDATVIQTHSGPIADTLDQALRAGLLHPSAAWDDIEMRFARAKSEYEYYTVAIRERSES